MKPKVEFRSLGLRPYQEVWDEQERLLQEIIAIKMQNRFSANPVPTPGYLLFCEHPHVYTLGKSGKQAHLLLSQEQLYTQQIAYVQTNRGGDITYHGPGQLVGYPILDLERFFTDIGRYMRTIEEAIIQTIAFYGIQGSRITGLTGVWVDVENKPRKIAAMGVRCSRWVTMHGFALNVNTDLSYFSNIVPCGISDKGVTSIAKEIGKHVAMDEVEMQIKKKLQELFNWEWA
ncbi:MAG: lipoyl(octanoyl) transferase LipB [Bacteroidia bacterium]|nr:lipoyl(octanoyl) transferase LipB [Bacteroidia bacterium]